MPGPGVHLATITITITLDESGDEITRLDYPDDLGVAHMLGVLELCKDSVLRADEDLP